MRSGLDSTSSRLLQPTRKLVILAPAGADARSQAAVADPNSSRYARLLADVQQFRGQTYLADGAIRASDLDFFGRHRQDADVSSWHLVALNSDEDVCGCSRYRIHSRNAPFSELSVSRAALAKSDIWKAEVVNAVEALRDLARQRGIDFVEVGGWAISEDLRRSAEAVRIALGTYALASRLGGCIGITTATVRHHSASVLRKIGGSSLSSSTAELPQYFDPEYGCDMQLLKFESAAPNPRMAGWIDQMRSELGNVEVIRPETPVRVPVEKVWRAPSWHKRPGATVAIPA